MNDVVRGEASESDDETLPFKETKAIILAAEVLGEASESDEDVYKNMNNLNIKNNADLVYSSNLLQRKLIDNNLNIWRSLNLFVKRLVTPASKQLLSADQLLIKSQLSMQSALVTLHDEAQSNIRQLNEKCEAIFTTNFIPNINLTNK